MMSRLGWSAFLAYHLRPQARYAFRPLDDIRCDQSRRVRSMAAHAYHTVPYYRETMDRLGLRPDDFHGAADLGRLPVLERDRLMRDPEYFVSSARHPGGVLRMRSDGSTGERRTVLHDAAALFQNAAHGERDRMAVTAVVGKRWGYREAVIVSPDGCAHEVQHFCAQHALFPGRVRIERRYLSVLDEADRNIALLNEFEPDIIHSYGSYLGILFRRLHETRAPFHAPKVITYSSDAMADGDRRLIAEEFGIPVFSTYQAVEAFKIGFECEQHAGLHVNVDLYPVRIVDADGRDLPADDSGDVVVSNLVDRATVLLNYRLGDIAAWLPHPCRCGRTLPLLSFVQGRSDDLIVLPSGRTVHPDAMRLVFWTDPAPIWQFQVVQRSDTHFSVRIVLGEGGDRAAVAAHVASDFARRFGAEVSVDIAFVGAIERTPRGKLRPVIALRQSAGGPGGGR